MPNKLTKLMISKVALCQTPANSESVVSLFKHKLPSTTKKFGVKVQKDGKTTNDVLAADEFWNTYYELLDAFRASVFSIMYDSEMAGKDQAKMLETSVSEISDNLNTLFDSYPFAKTGNPENDEIYEKYEKTVDVLGELDKLIFSGQFSAEQITELLGDFEMADKTDKNAEMVETLKAQLAEKETELTKAKKDLEDAADAKKKGDKKEDQDMKKSADEPVDIWKGVNPEIKAQFEALQKSADESQKIAKAAEENAAMVKLEKRVGDELPSITGTTVEKANLLRDIEKMLPADKFEKLFTILKSASVVIAKSELLNEKGSSNTSGGNTAMAKINAKAKEILVAKGATTEAKAMQLAIQQNPELYNEYLSEDKN